jgi:glutathionylspermidine synthase
MNTSLAALGYIQHIKAALKKSHEEHEAFSGWLKSEADRLNTEPLKALCAPKLYSDEADAHFKYIAETIYSILNKVCLEYLQNPSFRPQFGFDSELEELIASPAVYPDLIPMLRVDLFYNEEAGSFKFCEFNTDGTSGMYEESVIASYIESTEAFKMFSNQYSVRRADLFQGWVDAFYEIYSHSKKPKDHPSIAICDFLESGVAEEFEVFRAKFEEAGSKTVIADIRDIGFDGESYVYKGEKINAVYRRAVTGEMMAKREAIPAFLEGIRSGKVCVIGHLRTQTAHVKNVFSILRARTSSHLFTEGERAFIAEHVPFTTMLTESNYDYNSVLHHKERWAIKPVDEYASRNVTLGVASHARQWRKKVEEGVGKRYILQEYIQPFKSPNCLFEGGKLIEGEFGSIIGLFVYNGRYSGIFTRVGQNPIISAEAGGFSVASMVAKEKG